MKKLIQLMELLVKEGLIAGYSIGGATALIFYFEPIQTQDVDIFVLLDSGNEGLVNLAPIYDFFRRHSCPVKGEYILVDSMPLQLLVPYNDLVIEAVKNHKVVKYGNVTLNILSLEYLMAIMVQTNRLKDQARLEELVKMNVVFSASKFNVLLKKYKLSSYWNSIKARFAK